MTAPASISLMGIDISRIDAAGACAHIFAELDAARGGWIITPNLDILRRLVRDAGFREECAETNLRLADGMPLVWASRIQRTPLPERVAGSDLIWRLAEGAARARRSIYLLGGNPGSAEAAARVLKERNPALEIAGICCPPYGFENDPAYLDSLDMTLADIAPDVVFVGLGSPKQERLIRRLRHSHPGAWYLGVGVTFSFVAGDIRRAPVWVQRLGLEWFHRLVQEPRRLARRYLIDGIPFAIALFARSAMNRFRRVGAQQIGETAAPEIPARMIATAPQPGISSASQTRSSHT